MVAISRRYYSCGDKLVQIRQIVFFDKEVQPELMYCNRLHAWWSTQSGLATLLSSLIARQLVGLQTL